MPPGQSLTSEGAHRAWMVVELMRSTGEREFPAQLMSVFLYIAAHNGCRQSDVAKHCNMAASSVSRSITWLGPRHRLEHRSGLKLVRRERDIDDWRAWTLHLTPRGETFVGLLEQIQTMPLDSNTTYTMEADDDTNDDQDLG
jgi:DNA-binding MarR family transcriptional regulator